MFKPEAAAAVVKYGFETMRLNSIIAFIANHNHPSVNVITRLGFKEIPSNEVGLRKFEKAAI